MNKLRMISASPSPGTRGPSPGPINHYARFRHNLENRNLSFSLQAQYKWRQHTCMHTWDPNHSIGTSQLTTFGKKNHHNLTLTSTWTETDGTCDFKLFLGGRLRNSLIIIQLKYKKETLKRSLETDLIKILKQTLETDLIVRTKAKQSTKKRTPNLKRIAKAIKRIHG